MAHATMNTKTEHWLDAHVQEWVTADLISTDQAAAVRHHEHLDEPVTAVRLTTVAEVACYLGSVIALAGGAAIIGPSWHDLGIGGQLALAGVIAAVGFVVGAFLVRLGEAGTRRLGWFLWVVGTGGAALASGVVTNRIDPADGGWFPVVIGSTVAVIGLGLWRNTDRPLQLLTAGGGSIAVFFGVVQLTNVSMWIAAPALQALALAVGALAALERIRPRLVALMSAGLGLMVGAISYAGENGRFAALAAVVSAAVIVAYALTDRSWPLVALGLVAFFGSTIAVMGAVLHNTPSRLVAVVLGLAVVCVVAVRAQRMSRTHGSPGARTSG